MIIDFFHITDLGLAAYSFWLISSIWITIRKQHKLISIIFPLFAITEGLFIDWRWGRLSQFDANTQILVGGSPSFLIAIGFPFIGFYLHHIIPRSCRSYLSNSQSFPFSEFFDIPANHFDKYYKVGFAYSVSTLFLHELSQILNISSRNTFDVVDLIAIITGSAISVLFYYWIKNTYHKT